MTKPDLTSSPFGDAPNGMAVQLFKLRNSQGTQVCVTTFGGRIHSLLTPDRNGNFDDVVLGYEDLNGYRQDDAYLGALIGRYANRIAGGRFELNGIARQVPINNGPNSLHGGEVGFDKVVWKVISATIEAGEPQLGLEYLSADGEQGYPGNLLVRAAYRLRDDNSLRLDLVAESDADTIVNLTNHAYFNLRGRAAPEHTILEHIVQINADCFTPVDSTLIPTGEIASVTGTPFDFRLPNPIGKRIDNDDVQLQFAGGYDHNWAINDFDQTLRLAATAYEPITGRLLEISHTAPGLQFYSGNFLNGSIIGKGGLRYGHRSGFCFEPQHFPDSPNQPNFPSVVLRRGALYESTMVYRFSTR